MSRVIAEGVGTVWVRPKNGGIEMVAFAEGDEVPDWAAEQMGDHCFDADDAADDEVKPYSKWRKGDLEAEVTARNEGRDDADQIVVGGTGKVADLAAALDADDAAADD